jgi:hypothetical protein
MKELEEIAYFSNSDEISDHLSNTLQLLRDYEGDKSKRELIYEIELFMLDLTIPLIHEESSKRFYSTTNMDFEGWTDEQIRYYEKRLYESKNLFLKCRYADFLVEYGNNRISENKFQLSKILIPLLLDEAEIHLEHKNFYPNYFNNIARAAEISLKMKNTDLLRTTIPTLFKALEFFEIEKETRWILESSQIIRKIVASPLYSEINQEKQNYCIKCLEQAIHFYRENKNFGLHRAFCEESIEWAKIRKESNTVQHFQFEIGLSLEADSVHQQGSNEKSELVKAHFLEHALQHYVTIGRTDKVNEMKIKIRDAYEKAEKNGEFKLHSYSASIPKEAIIRSIEVFLKSGLEESLSLLKRSIDFVPDLISVAEITKEQNERPTLFSIARRSLIRDGKKLEQALDESDKFDDDFSRNYMIDLQLKLELLLLPIFEKLIARGLDTKILLRKLEECYLLDEDNLRFINVGIQRFFENDYISALHVLVPQYESILRSMFTKLGFATTSIKKGIAQHEETFNVFLEREDIRLVLGEDLHKFIEMVMVKQRGFNLRNNVAHGLMKSNEYTKELTVLVIYMYLLLANFQKK